jgi:thioredoxin-like negative regulator of GroEL
MSPAERRKCPDLWTSKSSKVQSIALDDCEQLLYDNMVGGLDKDVMLVVYAPWCPYCKSIEQDIEKLATGLQRDSGVAIMKLRGDSPAARLWLRAQLGVESFPSIIGFPQVPSHHPSC